MTKPNTALWPINTVLCNKQCERPQAELWNVTKSWVLCEMTHPNLQQGIEKQAFENITSICVDWETLRTTGSCSCITCVGWLNHFQCLTTVPLNISVPVRTSIPSLGRIRTGFFRNSSLYRYLIETFLWKKLFWLHPSSLEKVIPVMFLDIPLMQWWRAWFLGGAQPGFWLYEYHQC